MSYFLGAFTLFAVSFVVATAITVLAQDVLRTQLATQVLQGLQGMVPTDLTFAATLAKNIEATLVVLAAAAVLPARLGRIRPASVAIAAVLVFNGLVVGLFLGAAAAFSEVPLWTLFLTGVAPHGVLEIPALLATAVLGWSLVESKRQERQGWGVRVRLLLVPLRLYVLSVLPLLAGAAYIENNFTNQLLALVFSQLP